MRFDPHRPAVAFDFLERHEGAARLLPSVARMLRLKQDLFDALPPALHGSCEVAGCDDAVVVLHVSSASAATKMRQTLPRLQATLVERGWNVDTIRVRVKPRLARRADPTRASPTHSAIPASGIASFDDLGQQLEPSPLRAAVERLVRRRREG